MAAGPRTAFRRASNASALVEGDRSADVAAIRWSRASFLVIGLFPTIWLSRRLPIGFFYMFGFWTAVGSAGLIAFAFLMKWREPWLGRTIPFLAPGIPLGLLLLAMIPLSRADARGEALAMTDTQVRALAVALQAALAFWVARRTRQSGERVAELVVVYAAALATMTIRLTVAQNLSAWWFVPVVAVLAVRMATLPEQVSTRPEKIVTGTRSDPGDVRLVEVACAFVGIAGALALQAQVMSRPSGLAAFVVAFVAGLALLIRRRRPSPLAGGLAVTAAVGVFAPILFVVVLLMPSLAGARYLLDIGFRHDPDGLSFEGSRPIPGGYQRWYGTAMDERAALASTADAFRSPPVSAWPDADGHGVTGLLFGYRIETRYDPAPNPCHPDVHCVVVTVRRSTD